MADLLGQILTAIIIIGAILYALYLAYRWAKKENFIQGGKKKMGIFDQQQQSPTWEEYKNISLRRGFMSLPEINAKLEEGWELVAVPVISNHAYYYFRKVR